MRRSEFREKVDGIFHEMLDKPYLGSDVCVPHLALPNVNWTNGIVNDVIYDANENNYGASVVEISSNNTCTFFKRINSVPEPYRDRLLKYIDEYFRGTNYDHMLEEQKMDYDAEIKKREDEITGLRLKKLNESFKDKYVVVTDATWTDGEEKAEYQFYTNPFTSKKNHDIYKYNSPGSPIGGAKNDCFFFTKRQAEKFAEQSPCEELIRAGIIKVEDSPNIMHAFRKLSTYL